MKHKIIASNESHPWIISQIRRLLECVDIYYKPDRESFKKERICRYSLFHKGTMDTLAHKVNLIISIKHDRTPTEITKIITVYSFEPNISNNKKIIMERKEGTNYLSAALFYLLTAHAASLPQTLVADKTEVTLVTTKDVYTAFYKKLLDFNFIIEESDPVLFVCVRLRGVFSQHIIPAYYKDKIELL